MGQPIVSILPRSDYGSTYPLENAQEKPSCMVGTIGANFLKTN
jgi:hypothetical protein